MKKGYAALFRGLNVGGSGRISMKVLAAQLEELGLEAVETYLQSGNAVFRCEEKRIGALAEEIPRMLKERAGLETRVVLLEFAALERMLSSNPYHEAESAPASLHLFFFAEKPANPDLERLSALKADTERFVIGENVLYLHAPDGLGRSKFGAAVERALGVPVTARNWRTASELRTMLASK